ncbi:hypothetical protein [Demequina iriomotensis]|uniref:hypothetical protein n=1 Tax=Demequina iriomotensis TaxID=1536641 RepID=UPI0007866E03|nr:hypothetical protein [Demequina iriomotensis]
MAKQNDPSEPQPDPVPAPDPATEPTPAYESGPADAQEPVLPVAYEPPPSFLERVRTNRTGSLAAALVVALAVALLLAILVPDAPNLYALTLLGALMTAAVGFTVRYLAHDHGLVDQGIAFVATLLGVHVMTVTGVFDGLGSGGVRQLLEAVGGSGPGFDDALLASLATPAVSTGGVLAGLVAAVIVGWGPRVHPHEEPHAARHAAR